MPSSSRSKSHKKSKHSSGEYSDVGEDAKKTKMKEMNGSNDGNENGVSIKGSLVSGEKRKIGKDLTGVHGNGNLPEECATPTKRRKEKSCTINEWPVEGERNIELEKELEKRMRRRVEGYKHKDDKYNEDGEKDEKYHVNGDKNSKHRYEKHRDKNGRVREDNDGKKRKRDLKHRDVDCDQVVRHRDNRDRSRDNDKDEGAVYKTRKVKDQNCESEKRFMSDYKVDKISVNRNRAMGSPNGRYYSTRDHYRVSKQEETNCRDYNGNFNKDFTSTNGHDKFTQKDETCINDNNLSQVDNDKLSVSSSSYTRNNRFPLNHKYFPPPQTPFSLKNIPNWPFHFPNNNYIPFPSIFNPIMHQFAHPIFHQPQIYDKSVPPLLNNWGANDSVSGNGRVDWESSKTQVWEDTGVTVVMRSPLQKDELLSEQKDIQVELIKNIPEVMKVKKADEYDSFISRVYLSKSDISKDLTESDLYDQCTRMFDLDQELSVSDEFDCKILFFEEGIEADVSNCASLFAAINKSVFKKAMSLYAKQRERNQEEGGDSGVKDSGVEDSEGDEQLSTLEKMYMDVDAGVKDSGHYCGGGKEVDKVADGGCLLVVTTRAVMPELREFESVNLSRVHHSPESTH